MSMAFVDWSSSSSSIQNQTHQGRIGSFGAGSPLHRKTGKVGKQSLSGKTQGIRKFCQNTGKNFLSFKLIDSKVQDIVIFAARIPLG